MEEKKTYQIVDLKKWKGCSLAKSNAILRVYDSNKRMYEWDKNDKATFDPTRTHLNFEVTGDGEIIPVRKDFSIPERIKVNLKLRGIGNPNDKYRSKEELKKKGWNVIAHFYLSGTTRRIREIAFGDQEVNYGSDADNSNIVRTRQVEAWAVDNYRFMQDKYGKQNIVAFVVNLDTSYPHAIVIVLAVTMQNKFSWDYFIAGGSKMSYALAMYLMNDQFAAVNSKYGLMRGERQFLKKNKAQTAEGSNMPLTKEFIFLKELFEDDMKKGDELMVRLYRINKEIETANEIPKEHSDALRKIEWHTLGFDGKGGLLERILRVEEYLNSDSHKDRMSQIKMNYSEAGNRLEKLKGLVKDNIEKIEGLKKEKEEIERNLKKINYKTQMVMALSDEIQSGKNKPRKIMESVLWKSIADEVSAKSGLFKDFLDSLNSDQTKLLGETFKNSFIDIETLFWYPNEYIALASALLLGYGKDAIDLFLKQRNIPGRLPENWERLPEDDTQTWKWKCFLMASKLLIS